MIGSHDDPVKGGGEDARFTHGDPGGHDLSPVPSDPRMAAFWRLTAAIDASDPRAGLAATRELRRLGFNVVLIRPGGQREGR